MWLKISFPGNFPVLKSSVCAAVGSDGQLYFVAKDVGRMLGYVNCHSFATRYFTKDLFDVIPEDLQCYVRRGTRFVFSFPDMLRIIERTCKHHGLSVFEIDDIRHHFYHGKITDEIPEVLPFSPKLALPIVLGKDSQVDFQKWLAVYVSRTLQAYAYTRVMVAPPSVESDFGCETKDFETKDIETKIKEPIYSMVIKAEGIWALKPGEAIKDALLDVENKIRLMDADYTEDVDERCYEMQIQVKRREIKKEVAI